MFNSVVCLEVRLFLNIRCLFFNDLLPPPHDTSHTTRLSGRLRVRMAVVPLEYVQGFDDAMFVPEQVVELAKQLERGVWGVRDVSFI